MKAAFRQAIFLYLFWLLLFASFRPIFWLWQTGFSPFTVQDFFYCFLHGMYMDASLAGYFSVIPLLFFVFRPGVSSNRFNRILSFYQVFWITFVFLLYTIDLEIFRLWGHRLDSALIPYLKFPREALASSLSSPWYLLIPIWFIYSAIWIFFWRKTEKLLPEKSRPAWLPTFASLFFTAACILPIRGGIQLAPMNQSSVYFSPNRMLNLAAENPVWVFTQSMLENPQDELEKLYGGESTGNSMAMVDSLYRDQGRTSLMLNQSKPNIILIIWESLSSKVAGCTNGTVPSTPNLDRLAGAGLLFSRIYANGDRSEKGLVSILSAQPSFGKISLMSQPNLSSGFDFISLRLKKLGYHSHYFYGGELEFANMKSFILNAGFDQITGKEDFPPETWNSKWGAHDEVLFARQLTEASKEQQPFFHTLFTLSSHEPFEIPGKSNSIGTPTDTLFCQSHRYTDQCLGQWYEKAQTQSWWKNTLVVLIADHGHPLLGNSGESDPEKYRIPMIWFGPALKKNGTIDRMGSQTDLFSTLCRQLGDSTGLPYFSRNLLSDDPRDFAFYSFRNGSCLLDKDGQTVFNDFDKPNKASAFRSEAYRRIFSPRH